MESIDSNSRYSPPPPAMPGEQTPTLWCLVDRDEAPFEITVYCSDKTDRLKKVIKEIRQDALRDYDAPGVVLWKVRISYRPAQTFRLLRHFQGGVTFSGFSEEGHRISKRSSFGLSRLCRFLKVIGAVKDNRVPLRFLFPHLHQARLPYRSLPRTGDANRDIERHLQDESHQTAFEQGLNSKHMAWPPDYHICPFIYGSTVIRVVGDEDNSVETQIDIVLGLKHEAAYNCLAILVG